MGGLGEFMSVQFKCAVISDPHVALPETIWDHPSRFHLVEVSIPALEQIFDELTEFAPDFLLMPGDLTQHGERCNHEWLINRLKQLPFPTYVVPGNHDMPERDGGDRRLGRDDFPQYYRDFGYGTGDRQSYHQEILPGIHLIGLNSNVFDDDGQQLGMGYLDEAQFVWLEQTLDRLRGEWIMVMIHHNVIEHLPNQMRHPLGRRYMLKNNQDVLNLLDDAGVSLIFTGHLHVQDVAQWGSLVEITTGSLVSYPHPYRLLTVSDRPDQSTWLQIQSHRIAAVPDFPELATRSREWIGARSEPFMLKLLTNEPLNLPPAEAHELVSDLRYFWADVAHGDTLFEFEQFPAAARQYFESFSAVNAAGQPQLIDNAIALQLRSQRQVS